ncbi:MAG TPA: gluconate 2-dehydrogenase subunit 3 family protein [Polyangiaceae bacterium]
MTHGNPLKRRRFLKLGLGGAILLAIGGGAFKWLGSGYGTLVTGDERPVALTTKEFAVVKSVVRALLPADGALPSGESLGIAQRIDEELWAASADTRSDLKAGLQVLEHATIMNGYASRFTALEPAKQREYLTKLLNGSNDTLRQVAGGLRQIVHIFYYARPETWKAIGYDGPLVPKAVPPDSHLAYAKLLGKSGGAS